METLRFGEIKLFLLPLSANGEKHGKDEFRDS